MATLPRMFKPKSSSKSSSSSSSSSSPLAGKLSLAKSPTVQDSSVLSSGKHTLPRNSPSSATHESPSPAVKRQPVGASKTVSLSFNELKKQHQYSLKEVEDLRLNMMQMDMRHAGELDSMRGELSEADKTVAMLRKELKAKEAELIEKDEVISNMEAQCLKLELEKDRLLMVIECAQRDALTGEKIIPDVASWQNMVDEAHSQTEQFLHHMESMTTKLHEMQAQCQEQTDQIEAGINTFKDTRHFFV